MPYQLVYLPKSGNKNYWTIDHSFTHKMKNHCFWDNSAQLIADLPTLKAQYPTIFNNRRDDRFYLYDEDNQPVANVMEMMIAPPQTLPKRPDNLQQSPSRMVQRNTMPFELI